MPHHGTLLKQQNVPEYRLWTNTLTRKLSVQYVLIKNK